jgi:hypothetical protein
MSKDEPTRYSLQSSGLVFAPGFINWLRHFPKKGPDAKKPLKMLMEIWGIPKEAALKVLAGDCEVDGETVRVVVP